MARVLDFQFESDVYGKAKEYDGDNAIILAIRNILLSRPGNFPFNPDIGMDIQKYQFDMLDEETLDSIKKELRKQIALYIPDIGNVDVNVVKVEDNDGLPYLGISIGTNLSGENLTSNFILGQNEGNLRVFNETN